MFQYRSNQCWTYSKTYVMVIWPKNVVHKEKFPVCACWEVGTPIKFEIGSSFSRSSAITFCEAKGSRLAYQSDLCSGNILLVNNGNAFGDSVRNTIKHRAYNILRRINIHNLRPMSVMYFRTQHTCTYNWNTFVNLKSKIIY